MQLKMILINAFRAIKRKNPEMNKYNISKFSGLQSLCCAIIGITLSFYLDHNGLHQLSLSAGLFLTVTLILIVLGFRFIRRVWWWLVMVIFAILNIMRCSFFYKFPDTKPMVALPFLFIELFVYVLVMERLK